jgi:hypothetical protein
MDGGDQSDQPVFDAPARRVKTHTGSLAQRMMIIAAVWIMVLLLAGGLALDQALTGFVTRNFDAQLGYTLTAMVGSTEIGPDGDVLFNRMLGDQRFMEPNSGLYWQISGKGHEDYPSRSLWDRSLKVSPNHFDNAPHVYDRTSSRASPCA